MCRVFEMLGYLQPSPCCALVGISLFPRGEWTTCGTERVRVPYQVSDLCRTQHRLAWHTREIGALAADKPLFDQGHALACRCDVISDPFGGGPAAKNNDVE